MSCEEHQKKFEPEKSGQSCAFGLGWVFYFVLCYILFIYLNQCLVYSSETVEEIISHGFLESICIAWLRLQWEPKISSSFPASSLLFCVEIKWQKRTLVTFCSLYGKKEQFSKTIIIDCNTFMNRMQYKPFNNIWRNWITVSSGFPGYHWTPSVYILK